MYSYLVQVNIVSVFSKGFPKVNRILERGMYIRKENYDIFDHEPVKFSGSTLPFQTGRGSLDLLLSLPLLIHIIKLFIGDVIIGRILSVSFFVFSNTQVCLELCGRNCLFELRVVQELYAQRAFQLGNRP